MMRIKNMIVNNFWLKVFSLILAVATWFYVFDIVNKDSHLKKDETAEEIFQRYKYSVKEVPVKPVFTGRSPEGYRINFEKVKIEPATMHVFGPEEVIKDAEELTTERIDLNEYTRSSHIQVGVESDIKFLKFDEKLIDVYLPVETVNGDKK